MFMQKFHKAIMQRFMTYCVHSKTFFALSRNGDKSENPVLWP